MVAQLNIIQCSSPAMDCYMTFKSKQEEKKRVNKRKCLLHHIKYVRVIQNCFHCMMPIR